MSSGYRVLLVADIMVMIMDLSSYTTLVLLGGANKCARFLVQRRFNQRILRFIDLFVPPEEVHEVFKLLEQSHSSFAGSMVRAAVSNDVYRLLHEGHPSQLTIIVPRVPVDAKPEDQFFRRWVGLFHTFGYGRKSAKVKDASFGASVWNWSLLETSDGQCAVSVIESRTSSVFPPVFQASQTSSFFLLSSTRIYSLYLQLQENNINISFKHGGYVDIFEQYNYGMLSFAAHESATVLDGKCGQACRSLWRRTINFPGWSIFRWGGFRGDKDIGDVVSAMDPYITKYHLVWKLSGECDRPECEQRKQSSIDIFDDAV